ncbi:MAG: outer membrane beta-barrel protein [Bacteroidales bacterium]|jgi:hypothetical protein|nr:outer membrane beta-barrel protein [Bacteroidales bacterium]
MKKGILVVLASFIAVNTYSQQKNWWSIELNTNTNTFLFKEYDSHFDNDFHYGFSLLGSFTFTRAIQLSSGISYTRKHFSGNRQWITGETDRFDLYGNYFSVPIYLTITAPFGEQSKFKLYSLLGLTFHKFMYNSVWHYADNSIQANNYLNKDYDTFVTSYRVGLGISAEVLKNLNIKVLPFFEYQFEDDISRTFGHFGGPGDERFIPAGGFSVGINIGFEYMFRKSNND